MNLPEKVLRSCIRAEASLCTQPQLDTPLLPCFINTNAKQKSLRVHVFKWRPKFTHTHTTLFVLSECEPNCPITLIHAFFSVCRENSFFLLPLSTSPGWIPTLIHMHSHIHRHHNDSGLACLLWFPSNCLRGWRELTAGRENKNGQM